MIMREWKKLPSEQCIKDLTDEQIFFIAKCLEKESGEELDYKDTGYEEWEAEASKDKGWATYNNDWVEVPYDDSGDDPEEEADESLSIYDIAARKALRRMEEI